MVKKELNLESGENEIDIDLDFEVIPEYHVKNLEIDLGDGRKATIEEAEVDSSNPADHENFKDLITSTSRTLHSFDNSPKSALSGPSITTTIQKNGAIEESSVGLTDTPLPATEPTNIQVENTLHPDAQPFKRLKFSDLLDKYIANAMDKKVSFRDNTRKTYLVKVKLFIDILGDKYVDQYTYEDADRLMGILKLIPGRWKILKKYRDIEGYQYFLDNQIPEKDRLDVNTINNYMTIYSGFFVFAEKRGYLALNHNLNVFMDKQLENDKRPDEMCSPFDVAHLEKIFSRKTFIPRKTHPWKFWVPLVGLLTGTITTMFET